MPTIACLHHTTVKCNTFHKQVTLEAFAATEFNEISSGRQPRQDVKFFQLFGNYLCNVRQDFGNLPFEIM
jgi:hypothetical protein